MSHQSIVDRVFPIVVVVSLLFLAFIAGAWWAWRPMFPFEPHVRQAFTGLLVTWQGLSNPPRPFENDLWMAGEDLGEGVVHHLAAATSPGYTLITAAQRAALVDLDGTVLHEWALPYAEIRDTTGTIADPPDDSFAYWWPAKLFPNGDLMVIVDSTKISPQGLALLKLDRDSRPVWIRPMHAHHDFAVADDGRTYVLDQAIGMRLPCRIRRMQAPFLDDGIVTVSADGEVVDRLSILDAFCNAPAYAEMLDSLLLGNRDRFKGDYLHANAVDIVTPPFAGRFPVLKAGQLVVSLRELDLIAAIDVDARAVVWALRGAWHRQHDPDLLDSGRIVIFDNQGDFAGGGSRVLEFDPATLEIVWQYPSAAKGELRSAFRSSQQVLPNGNVLITEFEGARILEVTRNHDVVWDYVSPFRDGPDGRLRARILFAERYPASALQFALGGDRHSELGSTGDGEARR